MVALLLGSLFCVLGFREITNEGFYVNSKSSNIFKRIENYNSRFSIKSSEDL